MTKLYSFNAESQKWLDDHRSVCFAATILKATREAYAHGHPSVSLQTLMNCEQVWDSIPDQEIWSLN